MADIKTTVDKMTKTALQPVTPEKPVAPVTTLTIAKIEAIARELAQPWKYGTALHRFARLHGVPLRAVREIRDAMDNKVATFEPVEVPE